MRLVILGAGGYGRTVADAARQSGQYAEICFLDDRETAPDVLGKCADFANFSDGNTEMIPAFGSNDGRLTWIEWLTEAGIPLATLIHATAYISPTATIEPGTVVLPHAVISTNCHVKRGCIVNCGALVDHGCVLEEGVHVCLGAIVKAENRIPRGMKVEAGRLSRTGHIRCKRRKRHADQSFFQEQRQAEAADHRRYAPEIIRLAEVIKKCRRYFDVILAHTGQNYDYNLNGVFFRDLELEDPEVCMDAVGDTLGQTMGNIIGKSYDLMAELQPDAVLVLGDTNSCLSVIGAKRLHIPIFHMEAGNRCFDECLPEETNRRIVDVTADVNLCYSEHARRYLNAAGAPKERTYVTGSPMAEVLRANLEKIEGSDVLKRLGLEKGRYILLSAHREENIDSEKNFFNLMNSVNAIAQRYHMPILYSCHPRSKKFIEQRGFQFDRRVIQHQPMGFHDYNHLQINAFCVVSDSGTLPEESSFFLSIGKAFPAVCIRTSTERPEALDRGNFILAGITEEQVLQAVDTAVHMDLNGDLGLPVRDYMDENVSVKVVKIIQSYTGIVNRMVWRKD